jgi:hypothetical protein
MLRRRRPKTPRVDLSTLEPRWRRPVAEALEARDRFEALTSRLRGGPTRERLEALRGRLDAGVVACWEIASTAQAAATSLDALEPDAVTARMKDARRRLSVAPAGSPEAERVRAELDLLSAQMASVSRIWDGIDAAADRLRLLELRLDGAVARAAELLLTPASDTLVAGVEDDLTAAVDELEALRQAVASLRR